MTNVDSKLEEHKVEAAVVFLLTLLLLGLTVYSVDGLAWFLQSPRHFIPVFVLAVILTLVLLRLLKRHREVSKG